MTGWLPVLLAAAAAWVLAAGAPVGRLRLGVLRADRPPRWSLPWPLVAGAVGLALGAVAAVLAAVAALVLTRLARGRARATAAEAERRRALEALSLLAADLRAGRTPAEALAGAAEVAVGGVGEALRAAAGAARSGGDVPAALLAPASTVPELLRSLAACWAVGVDAGSGLGAGVDRLAEGLRAAEAQRRQVAAELAGPRATALLLAALPVGGIALAAALGADPLRVLLHTPAGVACLTAGLALDGLGLLWTSRLVTRAGGA